MKGMAGLTVRVSLLAGAMLLTTPLLAQEQALSLQGQQFLMHGMEVSQARGGGHRPMSQGRVCSQAMEAGNASWHAHIVRDETGQPFATTGPSGYSPTDLRTAYSVTGTGASGTL